MPRLRTRILVLLLAAGAAVSTLVGASPAQASATGCAWWGVRTVGGYQIPAGQYCFTIHGGGLTVTGTTGSFNTPVLYNWSETVRFYNNSNSNYSTFNKPVSNGAAYGYHLWSLPVNGTAQPGRVCGELKSSGVVIARVCHNVY